ncbi:MAG: hypothetical protein PHG83_03700 [Patescibacteria group bacterium]|nr:hypothetical protein [Patescibacteria group bacterium]
MNIKEKLNKVNKALFIKLGQGGEYEKECLENSILKIGYNDADDTLCSRSQWQKIKDYYHKKRGCSSQVATFHATQIKYFYEEDENVLWITFENNKLYWCFSDKKVIVQKDKSRIRKVIGKWSCQDIKGKTLFLDNISGQLSKTQGFRGTICSVLEKDYLIKKITGEQSKEIKEAEESFGQLKDRLILLIKKLNPKDFELLIDLIFRAGGWQRLGVVGKTTKLIDLAIFHPITEEKAVVQIKCQTNVAEFNKYKKIFTNMTDYDRFFYVAHTPQGDLEKYINDVDNLNLYFSDKIAELAINSGLFDWVLKKVE